MVYVAIMCSSCSFECGLTYYLERHGLCTAIVCSSCSFECGFDLLGDSLSREIQLVKSVLREILSTTAAEASNKGRLSRQASIHLLDLEPSEEQEKEDREQDQNTTAEQHWKYTTLGKCLRAWIQYVAMVKKAAQEENVRIYTHTYIHILLLLLHNTHIIAQHTYIVSTRCI